MLISKNEPSDPKIEIYFLIVDLKGHKWAAGKVTFIDSHFA
jgi:hypothetical protein